LAVVGQPLPEVLLPKLLSFMTYFDFNARVTGLDAFAPEDRPPVTATAMSFHAMLWLGLGLAWCWPWVCSCGGAAACSCRDGI